VTLTQTMFEDIYLLTMTQTFRPDICSRSYSYAAVCFH